MNHLKTLAFCSMISLLLLNLITCKHQSSSEQWLKSSIESAQIEPLTVISDPYLLKQLEENGYSFGEMISERALVNNLEYMKESPKYQTIINTVISDIQRIIEVDQQDGLQIKSGSAIPFMGLEVHRQGSPIYLNVFNLYILDHQFATYDLIGISNRIDRQRITGADACGEYRFIYRLKYDNRQGENSRLPMTLQFIGNQVKDCAAAINKWRIAPNASDFVNQFKSNFPINQIRSNLTSIEMNLQSQRWLTGLNIMEHLGGHIEYILRKFTINNNILRPDYVENVPDLDKINADGELKTRLKNWILNNLPAINTGDFIIPEEFLATKTISIGPKGLSRRANRPFLDIFNKNDFADAPLSRYPMINTPESLLRRLDTSTCGGCHQSRSLAGFHLLGQDRENKWQDGIFIGLSAHLLSEIKERKDYMRLKTSNPEAEYIRQFPERAISSNDVQANAQLPHYSTLANYFHSEHNHYLGRRCYFGSSTDTIFSTWGCQEGWKCVDLNGDQDEIGVCLPSDSQAVYGGPTEIRHVTNANHNFTKEQVEENANLTCYPKAISSKAGFPNGFCVAGCVGAGKRIGETLSEDNQDTICGYIPERVSLNACVFEQGKEFIQCVGETSSKNFLRSCNADTPCRDDYLCTRYENMPDDYGYKFYELDDYKNGVCVPPYFLLQARIDGHRFNRKNPCFSEVANNRCSGATCLNVRDVCFNELIPIADAQGNPIEPGGNDDEMLYSCYYRAMYDKKRDSKCIPHE